MVSSAIVKRPSLSTWPVRQSAALETWPIAEWHFSPDGLIADHNRAFLSSKPGPSCFTRLRILATNHSAT
jgi:hypothetical protein